MTTEDKVLRAVNAYRRCVGLSEIVLDADLCRGCALHAQYLIKNHGRPELEGLKAHTEDSGLPGFSEEGKRAGLASIIAFDAVDPPASGQVFDNLLLPPHSYTGSGSDARIGFGAVKNENGSLISVMDIGSGVQSEAEAENQEWRPAIG